MRARITGDRAVRVGALVAVAVLHLPVMLATSSRERVEPSARALRIRFIASTPRNDHPAKEDVQVHEEIGTSARVSALRAVPEARADVPAPSTAPRTDWYLQSEIASQAAIDAIIRDEAYRALGPREKRHQIVEPKPPPPLFEEPKYRAGDIAPNPMGLDSVWHSNRCFTQLEQPLIPYLPRGPGELSSVNQVKCLFALGKEEARGDLFEHLKKERDKAPLPGESPRTP